MFRMNDATNNNKNVGGKKNRRLIYVGSALLGAAILVIITAFITASIVNKGGGETSSEEPNENQTTTFYDPCADDDLEEKPLSCFVSISYTPDFIRTFQSLPDDCWVIIDGYAYDITPGENGYVYPGPGSIDHLCGMDASERFGADGIDPPGMDYLKGQIN